MSFSGSYDPDDVQFLLKPVAIEPTEVREKERLIQSGGRHYSEMIGIERPPEQEYLRLFYEVFETNRHRFAHDVVRLARRIAARISGAITLVSLARAGTPIGVLLRRTLRRLGRPGMHFSISIIRDHGWDNVAVDKILQTCEPYSVVFIDGWTGKGAIAAELRHSIAGYSARHGFVWQPSLAVVADPAGVADHASTAEDYLIPCSLLNAVISGLISRTILNRDYVGSNEYHACRFYSEFASRDLSRWFVDTLDGDIAQILREGEGPIAGWTERHRHEVECQAKSSLAALMERYGISDLNRMKPGLGEATRSLLRRIPERLILRSPESPEARHLVYLAHRSQVPVDVDLSLYVKAVAIIRSLGGVS